MLHDHDLEAEQVLRALGGEVCPCLLILDVLRGAGEDRLLAARPFSQRGRAAAPPRGSGFGRLIKLPTPATQPQPPRSVPRATETFRRLVSDPQLQQMPAAQRDRILSSLRQQLILDLIPEDMAQVLGEAAEQRHERRMRSSERPMRRQDDAEERLRRAAVPACEAAIRAARRDLRPWAPITVECRKAKANGRPLAEGSLHAGGGTAALWLPVGWLNRVACRGLAVVEGHFVAWVDQQAPATLLTGLAVRWERRRDGSSRPLLIPCSIRRWPAGWELRWEG